MLNSIPYQCHFLPKLLISDWNGRAGIGQEVNRPAPVTIATPSIWNTIVILIEKAAGRRSESNGNDRHGESLIL